MAMFVLLTAGVALGAYILLLWFRGARKPALIGFHLLLGLGGVESLVVFLHQNDLADDPSVRRLALVALGLFGAAAFSGFTAPLFGKNYRAANSLLGAHVGSGVVGFLIFIAFFSRL